MWARTAWTVLLGCFGLALYGAQMTAATPNIPKNFKSEFGGLNIVKDIAVLDHTTDENFQSTAFVGMLVLQSERYVAGNVNRRLSPWADDDYIFRKRTEFIRIFRRDDESSPLIDQIVGRSLSSVFQGKISSQYALVAPLHAAIFYENISSQLSLGGPIATSNEADSSAPQHQRDYRKQPFTGLNAEDRRFRSVLAATFALLFATWISLRGWTILGWGAAAYAIFGLMLRIDLCSLAIRIM